MRGKATDGSGFLGGSNDASIGIGQGGDPEATHKANDSEAEHLRMMRDACAEDGRHLPDAGGGRDKAADGSGELEMQRDVIG